MAFQKASAVIATKGGKRERPDVEDAFEESDQGEVIADAAVDEEEEEDLSKDKMIKQKTAKAKGKTAAPARKPAAKKAKK
jgi:replication factor C subunit 1